jgi:acyl-CoA dehydrogenase
MSDDYQLFDQSVARIFDDHLSLARRDSETNTETAWKVLGESGLTFLALPEALGGGGGGALDASRLLVHAGRVASPLPVAESAFLASGLLARAGLMRAGDLATTPLPHPGDELRLRGRHLTGRFRRVPWGARADSIVSVARSEDGDRVVAFDPRAASLVPGETLAGDPCDELTIDLNVGPESVGPPDDAARDDLNLRGALSRALLVSGALETVTTFATDFARQRHQFGRPLLSFQAVGQHVVQLIEESEATITAVETAARRYASVGADARFEIAAAKIQSARAATQGAAHAHQIHGAIGMSQEYPLHHLTRRLWVWRQEWGSSSHWSRILGRETREAGPSVLWDHLTTGLGRS